MSIPNEDRPVYGKRALAGRGPRGVNRGAIRRRAAQLTAEDAWSDRKIAKACGIARRTLARWKKQEAFQGEVKEYLRELRQTEEANCDAEKQLWLGTLNRQWLDLQELIQQRAQRPAMQDVAGWATGLLRAELAVSSDRRLLLVECSLDCEVLRAMRGMEMQTAKRLQQWGKPVPERKPMSETGTEKGNTQLASGKLERAALLVADNGKSDLEIARACGMDRRTLSRLKQDANFVARVQEIRAPWEGYGIANKRQRLQILEWRLKSLKQIVEERRKNPARAGGDSGLVVWRRRTKASGIVEYCIDANLRTEIRLHEQHVAHELGSTPGAPNPSGEARV